MDFTCPRACRWRSSRAGFLVAWAAMAALATPALAGGGSENVFLVVNARSWASRTVANHFVYLRRIPFNNVFYLDWGHSIERVDVETFRRELLAPTLQAIERRRLADHIDYLVYSSDFPWSVDARKDTGNMQVPKQLSPIGSLNGMTYLWQMVMVGNLNFLQLDTNHYFRRSGPGEPVPDSHGFRSWYGWGSRGELLEAGGQHYLLSTMLAVTSGRGNSVPEVINYLQRSAAADGSFPKGTIYYMKNSDVRSATRHDAFPAAVEALRQLDVKAQIEPGQIPIGRRDVQGAMLGTEKFSWSGSKSTILRGAICEHLTSAGGNMMENAGQTCLSALLHSGAAAASGAVSEPFAIQAKFPVPAIHVHYARGCSLAESFYQSVQGPYQLLVVGDPLCRPWANIPRLNVRGVQPGATVQGVLTLEPVATIRRGAEVDRFELFVDGASWGTCQPGRSFTLDTTRLVDGYHEIRVVAFEAGPIESQGRRVVPLVVNNRGRQIEFVASAQATVRWDQPLQLWVKAPGAIGIVVLQGPNRVIGKLAGAEGQLVVKPQALGSGPVSLRAVALGPTGTQSNVISAPIELEVEPSLPMPGIAVEDGVALLPGVELVLENGAKIPVADTSPTSWLGAGGVKAGQKFTVSGLFDVKTDDVYQIHVRHVGQLAVEIDGHVVYDAEEEQSQRRYIPLSLGRGRHRVLVRGVAADPPRLELRFGYQGVRHFNDRTFKHPL